MNSIAVLYLVLTGTVSQFRDEAAALAAARQTKGAVIVGVFCTVLDVQTRQGHCPEYAPNCAAYFEPPHSVPAVDPLDCHMVELEPFDTKPETHLRAKS